MLTVATLAIVAAVPVAATSPSSERSWRGDNLKHPLGERQTKLRQAAMEAVLRGDADATGPNQVVSLHRERGNKFVELAFEGEDQILTLAAEFGDDQATHNHGSLGTINHAGVPGPSHNQIPQPDRTEDNATIWTADFSQAWYEDLLYNEDKYPSMANWYLEQSSGQYSVDGYVSDWVEVQGNAAAYGSDYCGDVVCTDTWRFVNDQADTWWTSLVAELGSQAAANAWLATFDVWDRYDYDTDGDFDEPDGYIDHMQSVHAGEGQETGGGAQGENAIWSHRWYAWYPGTTSPDGAGPNSFGGARIGNSNYWIGDYTVEPENGGVGVFAHEFAHDLGLPDLYDTSGAENSTGWWTVMSQGSYGDQSSLSIGEYPTHFSAQEKFQLGFLENYTITTNTASGNFVLGPAEYNTARPQAMIVVLPDKEVTTDVGNPYEGTHFYYSGSADNLSTEMSKTVTLPAGSPSLSAKVMFNIEAGFDFAYVSVNDDPIMTSQSNSSVLAEGIEGVSTGWEDLTASLTPFAGQTVKIAIGYFTDGGVQGQDSSSAPGFSADAIQISGQAFDGAESNAGWTYESNMDDIGFHVTTGEETDTFFNAYVIENRRHIGYDDSLRRGPYNFGFPTRPNFVEHFRNEPGILVWYWDTYYSDNAVGNHPGHGLLLPIDSHPGINTWDEGTQMRPRINSYDSPFTIKSVRQVTLHNPATGDPSTIPSRPGVRRFDDSNSYYRNGHPSDAPANGRFQAEWNSVIIPNTGFDFYIVELTPRKAVLRINL